ncbi:hypothetical protein TNIN_341711 [Trichonephila inaurata madagascariensis]|uniref:Uncharacterized protein n=1 Tax=Trichonephila inaurata madagascariensis TaxID=2747483 RepID=A0A8X6XXB2_9ARAC|nr:hypothetical protein TNIN_341711 [Trichonephila inaurata madagascariensis]
MNDQIPDRYDDAFNSTALKCCRARRTWGIEWSSLASPNSALREMQSNLYMECDVVAYSPTVGNPTPGPKYLVAREVGKFSPVQASNAFRRHPNNQEDEEGWKGMWR